MEARQYDADVSLIRLRNQGRNNISKGETEPHASSNEGQWHSQVQPESYRKQFKSPIQNTNELEKRVTDLEEKNKALVYENSMLHKENERLKNEKEGLKIYYEEQIKQLKNQLTTKPNPKSSHKNYDLPFTKVKV